MKKIHPSWIIAFSSGGLLLGTALSFAAKGRYAELPWLIIGLSLLAISLINKRAVLIIVAISAGLLIGLWRGSQDYSSQKLYKDMVGKQVILEGTVSEDAVYSEDGEVQLKLKDISLNGRSLAGQVWVSTERQLSIKRSDRLRLSGKLSHGFGSFSTAVYRADIQKINRVKHGDLALEVRDWFTGLINRTIKQPEAGLGIGFLTGQHATLPEGLVANLRVLGLTHIIVASGYNLTILVRFARRAFAKVSKYMAALVSTLLIISFIMVTGASPSMVRAGLITSLSLAAWYYGRRIHPVILLLFSAALTVLLNPGYLRGDLGWYLSFMAFFGVIILSPLLLNYFWGSDEPNAILRLVVETSSAQILTAPIIAFSFGQYAPLALPANLLILPLIPFAMGLTFIAGLGGLLPLFHFFGLPAQLLLNYMTLTTSKLAGLPAAHGEISFSLSALIISYALIVIACIWLTRRTGHDFANDSLVE